MDTAYAYRKVGYLAPALVLWFVGLAGWADNVLSAPITGFKSGGRDSDR